MTKNVFGTMVEVPETGNDYELTVEQEMAMKAIRFRSGVDWGRLSWRFFAMLIAITRAAGIEWTAYQPFVTHAQASVLLEWYEKTPDDVAAEVENRVIGEAAGQGGLF